MKYLVIYDFLWRARADHKLGEPPRLTHTFINITIFMCKIVYGNIARISFCCSLDNQRGLKLLCVIEVHIKKR